MHLKDDGEGGNPEMPQSLAGGLRRCAGKRKGFTVERIEGGQQPWSGKLCR